MENSSLKYFLGALGLSALVAGGVWAGYTLYTRSKNNPAATLPKKINSILFIGDSNTAANFSYADELQKLYPALRIKKIALSGAKTDWMLPQLQNELAQNNYDIVAILGGSNDIYALDSITSAQANLTAMYNLAHANGAQVLAITPPNHNWYTLATPHKQAISTDLVNWIMSNTNPDYKINFWDITNNKNFFTQADGYLHAQAPAHKILADKTAQLLNL